MCFKSACLTPKLLFLPLNDLGLTLNPTADTAGEGTGNDFTQPGGFSTATFNTGVDTVNMVFTILPDAVREGTEYFTITLQNPVGGILYQPMMTTVYIIDESGKSV